MLTQEGQQDEQFQVVSAKSEHSGSFSRCLVLKKHSGEQEEEQKEQKEEKEEEQKEEEKECLQQL